MVDLISYPTLGQIFDSKIWFKKDRRLITAQNPRFYYLMINLLRYSNQQLLIFSRFFFLNGLIQMLWTDINEKKKISWKCMQIQMSTCDSAYCINWNTSRTFHICWIFVNEFEQFICHNTLGQIKLTKKILWKCRL